MHRRKQEEYEEENPHRTMPGETWLNSTVSREHLMGHTDSTNPAAHKAKGYQDREDHGLANDQKHRDISPPEVEGSTTDDAKNIYHSTSSSGSSLSSLQMLLREEDYNPAKEPGKGNTEDIDSKDKHRTHRQSHKKWRRVLYEKQDYPDDYLDDTFLASLVTNANVRYYSLWSMIKSTTTVINKISLLALVFVVFLHVWPLQPPAVMHLLGLDLLCTLAFVIAFLFLPPEFSSFKDLTSAGNAGWQGVIFLVALLAVAPVLQTLTQSFSDDTMWALTMLFSSVHIVFYDYKNPSFSPSFDGAVSLNAGMFATVLLASRLSSVQHVFLFTLAAIELFTLGPVFLDYIELKFPEVKMPLFTGLSALTFYLLRNESTIICVVYLTGVLFILLVCPLWFTYVMQYKSEIQGPWDIAVPQRI